MKITKRQLKRIIAEEHAIVYGSKTARRKNSKKNSKRLSEQRLNEVANNQAEMLMELGFIDAIKSAVGLAGDYASGAATKTTQKIGQGVTAVADAARNVADAAANKVEDLKKAGKDALADIHKEYLEKYKENLIDTVNQHSSELIKVLMKKGGLDEDEARAEAGSIVASVVANVQIELAEGTLKSDQRKLNERKRRMQRR